MLDKNKIINDPKFRINCEQYNLDYKNLEIYNDIILLNTPKKDLYIFFDQDYNTIGIESYCPNCSLYKTKQEFIINKCHELLVTNCLSSPFENYTIKDLIDLASRIDFVEEEQGHSFITRINGNWYNRENEEFEVYFQLLSYIKFLGEEIKLYFLSNYHMKMLGFNIPNISIYINMFIYKINQCINIYLQNNHQPLPENILSYLGQNPRKLNYHGMLHDIIDLLTSNSLMKKNISPTNELYKTSLYEYHDLSLLASQLLKILTLSNQDLSSNNLVAYASSSNKKTYIKKK